MTWATPTPWYIEGKRHGEYYIHAANHMMVAHVIQLKDAKLIVRTMNEKKP